MDKLKKALVGSILISVILAVTLTYVWATTPTTTFYISTGVYPGAPTYTIWTEGSGITQTYFCKRYDGYIPTWSGSTNASYVVNSAISSLTYGGKLYFLQATYGYTFTKPIRITHGYMVLEADSLGTTLKLASNANDDLIQIPYGSDEVTIRGFILDGNKKNNTAGNCIYANNTGLRLEHNKIKNATESNVLLNNPGGFAGLHWIIDNSIIWAGGSGIGLSSVYDCMIYHNDIGQNSGNNIYVYASASCEIEGNQIWGATLNGISLRDSVTITVNDNRIDYNRLHGISLVNENDTLISGNKIYLNGQNVTNTYAGIYVFDWQGASGHIYKTHNIIVTDNNCHAVNNTQRRGIEVNTIQPNAQFWLIMGNNIDGNLSSPALYWNGTTANSIIEHNVGYP